MYCALAGQDPAEKLQVSEKPVAAGGTYAGMALLLTKLKLLTVHRDVHILRRWETSRRAGLSSRLAWGPT
jgi:hypothetical protein